MPALLLAIVATGCAEDALYVYCDDDVQCGFRRYFSHYDEDDEAVYYREPLHCIEVTVAVRPAEQTVGNFCTLECFEDTDCSSEVGLPDGACIEWEGDAEAFCYQRCATSDECYPSSTCESVVRDGLFLGVCLPTRR